MPGRRPVKFSGLLAEPIYEPVRGGLLGSISGDDSERKRRVYHSWFVKHELLLDHYNIDRAAPDKWEMLSLLLAIEFVPGMQVITSQRPRRGRKQTWKAGLGDELVKAVQQRLADSTTGVGAAVGHLHRTDPRWKRFPRQTLEARYREAKRVQRQRRFGIAALMTSEPLSLGNLKHAYDAGLAVRGRSSLGVSQESERQVPDENSDK